MSSSSSASRSIVVVACGLLLLFSSCLVRATATEPHQHTFKSVRALIQQFQGSSHPSDSTAEAAGRSPTNPTTDLPAAKNYAFAEVRKFWSNGDDTDNAEISKNKPSRSTTIGNLRKTMNSVQELIRSYDRQVGANNQQQPPRVDNQYAPIVKKNARQQAVVERKEREAKQRQEEKERLEKEPSRAQQVQDPVRGSRPVPPARPFAHVGSSRGNNTFELARQRKEQEEKQRLDEERRIIAQERRQEEVREARSIPADASPAAIVVRPTDGVVQYDAEAPAQQQHQPTIADQHVTFGNNALQAIWERNEHEAKQRLEETKRLAEERRQKEFEARAEAKKAKEARLEKERLEQARAAEEQARREQREAEERAEKDRLEKERLELVRAEQAQIEKDRLKLEDAEKQRLELERNLPIDFKALESAITSNDLSVFSELVAPIAPLHAESDRLKELIGLMFEHFIVQQKSGHSIFIAFAQTLIERATALHKNRNVDFNAVDSPLGIAVLVDDFALFEAMIDFCLSTGDDLGINKAGSGAGGIPLLHLLIDSSDRGADADEAVVKFYHRIINDKEVMRLITVDDQLLWRYIRTMLFRDELPNEIAFATEHRRWSDETDPLIMAWLERITSVDVLNQPIVDNANLFQFAVMSRRPWIAISLLERFGGKGLVVDGSLSGSKWAVSDFHGLSAFQVAVYLYGRDTVYARARGIDEDVGESEVLVKKFLELPELDVKHKVQRESWSSFQFARYTAIHIAMKFKQLLWLVNELRERGAKVIPKPSPDFESHRIQ